MAQLGRHRLFLPMLAEQDGLRKEYWLFAAFIAGIPLGLIAVDVISGVIFLPSVHLVLLFYVAMALGPIGLILPSLVHGGLFLLLNRFVIVSAERHRPIGVLRGIGVPLVSLLIVIPLLWWYWAVNIPYGLRHQGPQYLLVFGVLNASVTLLLVAIMGFLFTKYFRERGSVPARLILKLNFAIYVAYLLILFPALGEWM